MQPPLQEYFLLPCTELDHELKNIELFLKGSYLYNTECVLIIILLRTCDSCEVTGLAGPNLLPKYVPLHI